MDVFTFKTFRFGAAPCNKNAILEIFNKMNEVKKCIFDDAQENMTMRVNPNNNIANTSDYPHVQQNTRGNDWLFKNGN